MEFEKSDCVTRQLCALLLLSACSATLSASELVGVWQRVAAVPAAGE